MSFERPTLNDLVTRIQADFVSRLDLVGAMLRRAMVAVFARVYAGAVHMLHGHLEYLGRQLFPDVSEIEFLERQASLFGLSRNAPDFGHYEVEATGTNGSVIPAGTRFNSSAGYEYESDAEVTISGGVATVAITALLAGTEPNLVEGAVLTFESPISNVDSTVEVTSVVEDGTDEETDDELRTRLLERMTAPAHGGNEADYIAWAKEITGVTRVWVYPLELGPGTVLVRFARDDDASPIPDAGEVTEVQEHIDEEAPAHATVTVAAPVDAPQNFTLSITPDTSVMREAIEAELEDFILREGEPGGTLLISAIRTTIGSVPGLEDYTLTIPAADVTLAANQLPSMGTITWV
jgi:uncharacterized phage protein gp47/JayE